MGWSGDFRVLIDVIPAIKIPTVTRCRQRDSRVGATAVKFVDTFSGNSDRDMGGRLTGISTNHHPALVSSENYGTV